MTLLPIKSTHWSSFEMLIPPQFKHSPEHCCAACSLVSILKVVSYFTHLIQAWELTVYVFHLGTVEIGDHMGRKQKIVKQRRLEGWIQIPQLSSASVSWWTCINRC